MPPSCAAIASTTSLGDHLELVGGGRAHRARHDGVRALHGVAADRADRRRRLRLLAELGHREILGQDLHLLGHARRHEDGHGLVDHLVGDDRVPLLDGVAQQRGAGHALHLGRHPLHPRLGLLGPGDDLLGLDVERRVELAVGEQHVAGRQPQQVLGVGAEVDLVLVGVHARPAPGSAARAAPCGRRSGSSRSTCRRAA